MRKGLEEMEGYIEQGGIVEFHELDHVAGQKVLHHNILTVGHNESGHGAKGLIGIHIHMLLEFIATQIDIPGGGMAQDQ